MQGWLETWIAQHEAAETHSVAGYVERELRAYLECGVLAHGFARARCGDFGADFLVAFSCKGRGVCPFCTTKRMVGAAAHLVDAVIPRAPMRQWVLALPKRLRPALRADPALATCVLRIFLGVIERALRVACRDAPAGSRLGAVSFVQRFGSALNEHWHYHCCVGGGLFAETGVGLEFPPATVDGAMAGRVQAEVRRRVVLARRPSLPALSMSLVALW